MRATLARFLSNLTDAFRDTYISMGGGEPHVLCPDRDIAALISTAWTSHLVPLAIYPEPSLGVAYRMM